MNKVSFRGFFGPMDIEGLFSSTRLQQRSQLIGKVHDKFTRSL